jgi:tRNA (guanosine-2'-O-)-methyltransferase
MMVIFGASPPKKPFHPSTLPVLSLVCLLLACGGAKVAPPAAAQGAPTVEGTAPLSFATTAASPELCANATDDNQNGLIDEGCGLALGAVQFLAGWGAAKADVDLRVMDPNGELIEVGRVARSGLTKDRDCPGRGTECRGRNLENVYLAEGDPLKGEYRLRLRLESLGGETPPIRVMLGARLGPVSRSYEVLLDTPESEREIRVKL